MYKSLPYKTKQFLFLLIKLTIIVGAFYFIYNKVVYNEHIHFIDFIKQLETSLTKSSTTIFILIVLTLLNWFFEILKWKTLASSVKKVSFLDALQQSLGALTASFFTPNRIGEYGAKAIYYKKGYRRKIMLLNLIGNSMQMATTTLFGLIGLIYFIITYEVNLETYRLKRIAYLLLALIAFIFFGSVYGHKKIQGFYIDRILNFIKELPIMVHCKTGFYSIIRYLIFSYQFYFLLTIFNVEISYYDAIILISSMYFVASIIPGLSLFDWLIKGTVAVWIFSFYPVNELIIVTITLLMWCLNFAIPAIFGSYFVLNFNFPSVYQPKDNKQ